MTRMLHGLVMSALVLAAAVTPVRAQEAPVDPQLLEALRLFGELEYERALTLLEQIFPRLERVTDEAGRTNLTRALELRGLINFTTNPQSSAEDFGRVLTLDPSYVLPQNAPPKLGTVVDELRKTRVATLMLVADPSDASIRIDGRPIAAGAVLSLGVGEHTITATRPGYREYSERVSLAAGGPMNLMNVVLARESAAVTLITSPPGVEILLNGSPRGKTAAGPLPQDFSELPERLNLPAAEIGVPIVLDNLRPGNYLLEFRKACYVPERRTLEVDMPRDIIFAPMVLKPAVSTLRVESTDPEAMVYIDDQLRGRAPLDVNDLCEGDHVVELRSSGGRYRQRVRAQPGGSLQVAGAIKPAFAVISVAGMPAGYRGQDLRVELERVLQSAPVAFIAPDAAALKPILAAQRIADNSLSFGVDKRPQGAAALMTAPVRRDLVAKIAAALDVQGVATITVVGGETNVQRVAVSLFAAGGSEPDVLLVDAQDPTAMGRAIDMLNFAPALSSPSLGMLLIEVTDVEGLVIARVDANGPAAAAGLQVGERLVQVLNDRTNTEADLVRVLEQRRNAESLAAFVVDREGTQREVLLRPVKSARLVSVYDRTLPFNALTAIWRTRSRRAAKDPEAALVRLNLAVAAYAIGDFETARDELEKTQLPDGPGISQGTVQYLLGLAYEGLSDIGRARQAFQRAATSEGATLSEQGGSIADLAKQKLAIK